MSDLTPRTTPRPWRTGDQSGTRDGVWSTVAVTSRGEAPDYEDSYLVAWCHSDYDGEADAALIVEAVNAYDRLRAALRDILALAEGRPPLLEHYRREIERIAREALGV